MTVGIKIENEKWWAVGKKDSPKIKKKILVGLTGTFGSGKSTVARIFEKLGAFVIDADRLAKGTIQKGGPAYDEAARMFEGARVQETGELDRQKIAKVIFSDPEKRRALEALVHPYVFQKIRELTEQSPEEVIVVEVPLLFESGFDEACDWTVMVAAEDRISEARLREKGFTLEEIIARRQAQMSPAEKKKRADFVIENSGLIQETERQAEHFFKKIRSAHEKGE